mmetsp:Transcript_25999/g.61707  ORF Transcript_25999/g.61707 Transcript_25999/m.61707 type:complete len:137 (-) Transcript_25999:786-1196(-)
MIVAAKLLEYEKNFRLLLLSLFCDDRSFGIFLLLLLLPASFLATAAYQYLLQYYCFNPVKYPVRPANATKKTKHVTTITIKTISVVLLLPLLQQEQQQEERREKNLKQQVLFLLLFVVSVLKSSRLDDDLDNTCCR